MPLAAQQGLQEASLSLEQQRQAVTAREREVSTLQASATERQLALDTARRAEAGLRERLSMAERQLAHQSGEVQALREANEKLELAVDALKVCCLVAALHGLSLMHGAVLAQQYMSTALLKPLCCLHG